MSSPHSSPQNVSKGRRRSGAPHGSPHVVGEGRGGIFSSGSIVGRMDCLEGKPMVREAVASSWTRRSMKVEPKGQKNNDCKDSGTVDASQRIVKVNGNGSKGSGADGP
jgi:hypothetical protein